MEPLLNKSWIFFVVILFFCPAVTASGKVIYVDDDATGVDNGSSWQDAYHYLQDALADANSAEKPVEIRVAQGIYKPDQGANQTAGDRTATFQLINGVGIKGGYAGFGELDPNARGIETHETILSGDLEQNDVAAKSLPQVRNERTLWENSYHVVTGSGTDTTAVLEGFEITAGRADGIVANEGGGGMYTISGSPILSRCTFRANYAFFGGGMSNNSASPTLTNCIFRRNYSDALGGAMSNRWSGPTLIKCVFRDNVAGEAGGMNNFASSPKLDDCVFVGNSCGLVGGGMYNHSDSNPMLSNCIFAGNLAMDFGIPGHTDGMLNPGSSNRSSASHVLSGNSGDWIYWFGRGGGICNDNSSPILVGCTFAGNSAIDGNAITCVADELGRTAVQLTNCILRDGGDEIWNNDASRIVIGHSNIQGGKAAVYDPCDGLVWGVGNINADPRFFDAGHWEDPCDTPDDPLDDLWVDGDYHLKSQAGRWEPATQAWVKDDVTSPCIDAGDPASPIGFEPFPNGGRINIGAYGGTAEASKSYFGSPVCETTVAGDINGDCKVDLADFAIMAAHWLEDNTPVNSNSILKDGIKYYMQTDKSIYHQGENVEMLYRVTNLRGEDVIFRFYDRVQYYFLVTSGGGPT